MLPIRRKTICLIVGIFILGVTLFFTYFFVKNRYSYTSAELTEHTEPLQNPYCGFFHLYGYLLSEEGTDVATNWCQQMLANDSQSLVLLQINLRNYSNQSISDAALEQLDVIFSTFAAADKQLIVRFLYDWDGKALETEPNNIHQLMSHMEQVASVVNQHTSHIFSLQGVFTGNCGEMNQTHYGTNEHIRLLMNKLADVIAPEIFLSVRTPSHLRAITGNKSPVSASESYTGTLPSRLGLYNDGMMGNVFDCGTYDDTSFAQAIEPWEKGTREEELAFQKKLCLYVPNGGETILENPYNDFENARADLATMRVSYLSCDYDANVLTKWKNTTYQSSSNDIWNGCNGYDYVEAHLGYRYVVTGSRLTNSSLELTLENRGFAPAYRPFETVVTLTNQVTHEEIHIPIDMDNRRLLPGESYTLSLSKERKACSKGDYSVSIGMKDPATGLPIQFANTTSASDGTVVCGTLTVRH